jgi:hypothetical protein
VCLLAAEAWHCIAVLVQVQVQLEDIHAMGFLTRLQRIGHKLLAEKIL